MSLMLGLGWVNQAVLAVLYGLVAPRGFEPHVSALKGPRPCPTRRRSHITTYTESPTANFRMNTLVFYFASVYF